MLTFYRFSLQKQLFFLSVSGLFFGNWVGSFISLTLEKEHTMTAEYQSDNDLVRLQSLLDQPLSRSHILMVTDWVAQRPQRINQVLVLVQSTKKHDAMTASWLLSHIYDQHPKLIYGLEPQLVEMVLATTSDSVRRNLLRIIAGCPIAEAKAGLLFDACLKWMVSEKHAIAVRANAMMVLLRLCCWVPELIPEVEQQISSVLPYASSGFRSRAKMVLKRLENIAD